MRQRDFHFLWLCSGLHLLDSSSNMSSRQSQIKAEHELPVANFAFNMAPYLKLLVLRSCSSDDDLTAAANIHGLPRSRRVKHSQWFEITLTSAESTAFVSIARPDAKVQSGPDVIVSIRQHRTSDQTPAIGSAEVPSHVLRAEAEGAQSTSIGPCGGGF